jgi:uncharacterized protein
MSASRLRILQCLLLLVSACLPAQAAEVIPPTPKQYVTDESRVLSQGAVNALDQQLDKFERDTSNQLVVAIYPHMQSNDDIDAYSVRVFRAWKIGQADQHRGNGVLLLIFTDDHKLRITTGYGLEGALPDLTAKQIIDHEITPSFKQKDFDGGVTAGVNAIIAATKGEYHGTGSTMADKGSTGPPGAAQLLFLVGAILLVLYIVLKSRSRVYDGNRWWWIWAILNFLNDISSGSGSGGGGGGWSGGGGSGGGGGFSGGGGSTGGGGASGSW